MSSIQDMILIMKGLANGTYQRFGGVIRKVNGDNTNGKIVKYLDKMKKYNEFIKHRI